MTLFPAPARIIQTVSFKWKGETQIQLRYLRFPCIHKSESGPDDFHFAKVLPFMNHVDVPLL
jgi:hypothetical protein